LLNKVLEADDSKRLAGAPSGPVLYTLGVTIDLDIRMRNGVAKGGNTWQATRNEAQATINWLFDVEQARSTPGRSYLTPSTRAHEAAESVGDAAEQIEPPQHSDEVEPDKVAPAGENDSQAASVRMSAAEADANLVTRCAQTVFGWGRRLAIVANRGSSFTHDAN
jgi:hypothetical protein